MALLEQPLTAFFASRCCSGRAIRAAMDWAVEQARAKTPLIGGLHLLLEQAVLEVMLAVLVIARKLNAASLPAAWHDAVQAGISVAGGNGELLRLLLFAIAVFRI